jgi:hypothetical protein
LNEIDRIEMRCRLLPHVVPHPLRSRSPACRSPGSRTPRCPATTK